MFCGKPRQSVRNSKFCAVILDGRLASVLFAYRDMIPNLKSLVKEKIEVNENQPGHPG